MLVVVWHKVVGCGVWCTSRSSCSLYLIVRIAIEGEVTNISIKEPILKWSIDICTNVQRILIQVSSKESVLLKTHLCKLRHICANSKHG